MASAPILATCGVAMGEKSSAGTSGDGYVLRIRVLGEFQVAVDAQPISAEAWRRRKAAALVKLLALAPGHALHREHVQDILWPDFAPRAAANNLHRTLHAARRALEPAPARPRFLRLHKDLLALAPAGALWIDAAAFEAAAARARASRTTVAYDDAVALYTGDLLPEDRYEDWAIPRRETLRRTYLELLAELARLREAVGDRSGAIAALNRRVTHEPTDEAATAALMRLHARVGEVGSAIRQYDLLASALRREFGVAPGEEVRQLRQALSGAVPRGVAAPPALPPATPPTNLPAALTSFIGRTRELATLRSLLRRATRLVTLVGPGGCGKTRLAIEVARLLASTYPGGTWLVDLAQVADPERVTDAVAAALGVRPERGRANAAALAGALGDRATLLILDNCEHQRAACAGLARELLRRCAGLHLLATSRAPLGIGGEATWRVPPLATPDPAAVPPIAIETLAGFDAIALFCARATLARHDFALTAENAAAVARIGHRLEGLPLAIELAAARVALLPPGEIADRLDDALTLLVASDPTIAPRHRTLRATFDWSYDALGERERATLRALAVFADGWTAEAAATVCAVSPSGAMLTSLGHLVDASLVVADTRGERARYRLLEPVRQYAAALLAAAGEEGMARRRHAAYFLALAEEAADGLLGAGQAAWFAQLDAEHDNLRAALSWAGAILGGEEATTIGLRLAGALWRYWEARGHLGEGRGWVDALLVAAPAAPAAIRAAALHTAGNLAKDQGDFVGAGVYHKAALALRRDLGDPRGAAIALDNLGTVAREMGDYAGAAAHYGEALALFRALGNDWNIANSLSNLARTARLRGDLAGAAALAAEALTQAAPVVNRAIRAKALDVAGEIALAVGEWDVAVARYAEGLALRRALDDRYGCALALIGLAAAYRRGGDGPAAAEHYREALALHLAVGNRKGLALGLEGLATLMAGTGAHERAARLWGAADALRAATRFAPPLQRADSDYARAVASARAALGPVAFAAANGAGRALTAEEAVAAALKTADRTPNPGRLTPREREVAALVARGLTNRRIAAVLGVAPRTIDTHVGAILRKLGVASRAQLAARGATSVLSQRVDKPLHRDDPSIAG